MANLDQPKGFRPYTGSGTNHRFLKFIVDSTNATNLFVGDVVDFDGTGVIPAAANAGVSVIGICVELQDSNGVIIGHPNSLVSTKYLPSGTAGIAIVALAIPGALFTAQAQTGQTPTANSVGATTDHVAGVGDTTTAVSRHELNLGDLNSGAQFVILGKVDAPNNDWGEANTEIIVAFRESSLNSTATGA